MGEWSRNADVQVKTWIICFEITGCWKFCAKLLFIFLNSLSSQSFDMRPHKTLGKLQSSDKVRFLVTPICINSKVVHEVWSQLGVLVHYWDLQVTSQYSIERTWSANLLWSISIVVILLEERWPNSWHFGLRIASFRFEFGRGSCVVLLRYLHSTSCCSVV